ncbi:MAG: alpha/beta hydrolase-fold protein [Bacteroidota bacterium]
MKNAFISILLIFTIFKVEAQSFDQLIYRLNTLPESQRQSVADSFMNSGHSFPLIENDTLVHFVYNTAAQSVAMAGDATGWNPNKNLANIAGCNFWFYSTSYETDARLDYKFVVNGNNWILDPKNPNTCSGGYGPNSELRMPAYIIPPEISYYTSIAHGLIKDTIFQSSYLGNSRHVSVYLPPGYPSGIASYPVVVFHDGLEYISLCKANNILDYLIAHQTIVPVIAVFVPPVDRTAEYAGNKIDNFTDFITHELMPAIDAKYKTSADPSKRAMVGASNGGNIALYIGMKHPEQFGKIAAFSSNVQTTISSTFSTGPKLNLEFYIDIGTYDLSVLIPMVHGLSDILQTKGYTYQFKEWHEGHSWGNWKGHLRLPLEQFFPFSSGLNTSPENPGFRLDQNRPNPFRDKTMIPFFAPPGSKVLLTLCDASGRMLETLFSGAADQSINQVTFYNHYYKPGNYLCTLQAKGYKTSKIITIEQ